MCTTCGCGTGNVSIEKINTEETNIPENAHQHSHSHDHHSHDEHHCCESVVIHHHHYYGPVNIHYHIDGTNSDQHTHLHEESYQDEPESAHKHHSEHEHSHPKIKEEVKTQEPESEHDSSHAEEPEATQSRMVQIEQDILAKNNEIAEKNRYFLTHRNITTLNLMSSPGSGKTTLLIATLNYLDPQKCYVIEGDQQTTNDADLIRTTGAKAIQVNTGKGCHLDAEMVSKAIARLSPERDSLLFIENVGNLVCPAAFDLGESHKIAILSVTEGEDKPLKYPDIFARADLMIINKADLLPYLDFDLEACVANARQVNPEIECIVLSAITGDGIQAWLEWLGSC